MYTPRSGIAYSPLLEWVLSAWHGGYTIEEFDQLDPKLQAAVIAAYQCEKQIDAVLAWENRPREK